MKLLIIPSWYPTDIHPESGTFFKDRAMILQRCGFSITIVTHVLHSTRDILKFNSEVNNENPIKENEVLIYKTESVNLFPKIPKRAFKMYKDSILSLVKNVVEKSKPEFVFINSSLYGGAAVARYLHSNMIPFMVSEHLKEFIIDGEFSIFEKNCISECYKYASKIIATSDALKSNIIKKFNIDRKKVMVIPNPADSSYFLPKREKLDNPFTFLSIALLRSEKRLDLLIKAFAKLHKIIPNIVLTIIGDGPEKSNLQLLSQKLQINDRVNFIGYQKKAVVADVIRNHDVLVLSSDVETFGVVLVEAMTVGLPVIATKCGGPESIVLPDTGILIEPNNSTELYTAMKNIIDKYDEFDSIKIREIALKSYSDNAYGNNIREAINSVISASN